MKRGGHLCQHRKYRLLHLRGRWYQPPADETVCLHNQRISAQTVRNHLREAHLCAVSWKCPSSSMACILTRSHPLSIFGMPIHSNFAQPLKRSGTSHRPQSLAWSTLYEGDVSRGMRQLVVTPDTDWFSDPRSYLLFFWKVSVTNRCIYIFPVMGNA